MIRGIYRYMIFHRQQLDIKHQIGGKSRHLNFYPISGHVYNLGEAYREFLESNVHSKKILVLVQYIVAIEGVGHVEVRQYGSILYGGGWRSL